MDIFQVKAIVIFLLVLGIKGYGQVSMDYYHGTADINIPLYEVAVDGVSIPISLSYTTGGIPLSQQATTVGLGWSLNAEYAVKRFINDYPDDYHAIINYENKTGWLYNYWNVFYYQNGNYTPYIQEFYNSDTSNILTSTYLQRINKFSDSQPDNFFYTTSSSSGQFIFDEKPVPSEEYNNIMFLGASIDSVQYGLIYDQVLGYDAIGFFEILDSKGNKFTYDVKESSSSIMHNLYNDPDWDKQNSSLSIFSQKTRNDIHTYLTDMIYDKYQTRKLNYEGDLALEGYTSNTWKISGIETSSGNKIYFTYEDEVNQIDNFTYQLYHNYNQYGKDLLRLQTQLDQYPPITYCTEHNKRIKTIETNKNLIVFNYIEPRLDVGIQIPPTELKMKSKQLNNIKVYSKSGKLTTLIKEYIFIYSYFDCLVVPANNLYNQDVTAKSRLRLDRVDISDGINILSSYKFGYDYNELRKIPSRFSNAQDFWGFYNGATTNETLLPKTYLYLNPVGGDQFRVYMDKDPKKNPDYTYSWGNRDPNAQFAAIGSLNKVTYPTGGFTEFEYELNTFMHKGYKYDGAGLRVSKIVNKTGSEDASPNIEKIIYEGTDQSGNYISFGKVNSIPVFGFFDPTGKWPYQGLNYDPFLGGFANSNNLINDFSDGIYGYSKIFVLHGENGEQGKTEMNFENSVMAGESDTYLNLAKPNIYPIKTQSDFSAGRHFNSTVTGSKLDFNTHGYPYVLSGNYNWKRGFLLSILDYDLNGNKIHEVVNEPEYFYSNGSGPKTIFALKQGNFVNNSGITTCTTCLHDALTITAKYPILTGVDCRIKSTTETTIDVNHSLQQTLISNFIYNKYNQISKIHTVNSNGIVIQNSIKYPSDYIFSGNESDDMSKALFSMRKYYHMLDYPIETISERVLGSSKEVTDGTISLYKRFNGEDKVIVLTNTQLQLQRSQPITNLATSEISVSGIFNYNHDYYKEVSLFDKYNSKGKLVEYFQKDGSSITNIFSGDSLTIIASVVNARKNECAYTGFETGDYFFINDVGPMVETPYTGKYCIKPFSSGAATTLKVGNEAKKHSGYKASVWIKGNQTARISIGVFNSASSYRSASNFSPSDEWHLIEVELPYDSYKDMITDQLIIEVKLNCTGSDFFDDLRILPMDAIMTSIVFDSKLQVSATIDERNIPTRYTYDSFGRNTLIQDQNYNIIKKTVYNIKPQ